VGSTQKKELCRYNKEEMNVDLGICLLGRRKPWAGLIKVVARSGLCFIQITLVATRNKRVEILGRGLVTPGRL
jgi:hypothetical protein